MSNPAYGYSNVPEEVGAADQRGGCGPHLDATTASSSTTDPRQKCETGLTRGHELTVIGAVGRRETAEG